MSSFKSISVTPLLTAHQYNQSQHRSLITGDANHQYPQNAWGPCFTLCKVLLTFGVRVVNEIVKLRCAMTHKTDAHRQGAPIGPTDATHFYPRAY
jgi:hypothetical protein